ncbi:MAG TPA: cytochrome c oxidase assembly protein [Gammaproteobacteria bacterium]|nr:cytochrome c oxidase assembly protein [Gammaproteobacteria bacterium]
MSPLIVGGCLLAVALYARGLWARRTQGAALHIGKAVSFLGAATLTYGVLQGPLNALSPHLFWANRAQSLALYDWVPILLVLAAPVPELAAGVPHWLRRALSPPAHSLRGLWEFMQAPLVAPIAFLGMVVFWLTPKILDLAVTHGAVSDLMHATMLMEGVCFWWFILAPHATRTSYGRRIMTLWAVMLPQMLLGFYVMFTPRQLYSAIARHHWAWPVGYMVDQNLGGLVVWVPVVMTSALAAVLVLRFWMREEQAVNPASEAPAPVDEGVAVSPAE